MKLQPIRELDLGKNASTKKLVNQIRQQHTKGAPLRETCLDLSHLAGHLIKQAEKKALANLSRKILAAYVNEDGEVEVLTFRSEERIFSPYKKVKYKDKDYFICATGSLGRSDDFVFYSDLDYLVFPTNEDSVIFAKALQIEMDDILQELIKEEKLPFKVDEGLHTTPSFQIPPARIPAELLVTHISVPDPFTDDLEFIPSITSRVFRDLKFISGNKEAFDKLIEVIAPILHPYDEKLSVTNKKGHNLVVQMKDEAKASIERAGHDIELVFPDLKDDVLRLFHHYTWVHRAENKIGTNSVFDTLEYLPDEEGNMLAGSYEFFLRTRIALDSANRGTQNVSSLSKYVVKPNAQTKIAKNLRLGEDEFKSRFNSHLMLSQAKIALELLGLDLLDIPCKPRKIAVRITK